MISVCIPTYNGEKFVIEQLQSILKQLSCDDEVIISDDSSSDNTVELIKSLRDNRIKILEGNKFKSPIYNLENALKEAKGDFIFTADQDDIWFDNKVARMLNFIEKYDCVVSDAVVIDEKKCIICESFMRLNHSKKGLFRNIVKNSFLGCCMCFRREILTKALPFPKPIPMHDTWIGLVSEKYGKTYFLDEPLIYYRRHGNNVSSTSEQSKNSMKTKLYNRFLFLINIIKR